jgi:hypothetical protein
MDLNFPVFATGVRIFRTSNDVERHQAESTEGTQVGVSTEGTQVGVLELY